MFYHYSFFYNGFYCILFACGITATCLFSFCLVWMIVVPEVLFYPKISKVKCINNLFWGDRSFLYRYRSHVSTSFFITYFLDDKPAVINHKMCLCSRCFSFILPEQCIFLFLSNTGLGICCSMYNLRKQERLGNTFQLYRVFNLFIIL